MLSYRSQVITACIFYIVAYSYILYAANQTLAGKNKLYYEACLVNVNHENTKYLTQFRGKAYNMVGPNHKKYDFCVMTYWNLTHLLLYTVMGFFCPDLFIEAIGIGLIFELAEYKMFDCHDVLDLFYNAVGFIIGRSLARKIQVNS